VSDTNQGGKLLRVIAERLIAFAPNWKSLPNDEDEACIHRAVTTLMMLLTAAKDHPIPDETKAKLVSWLETWAVYKSWSPESMGPYFDLPKTCFALSHMLRSHITRESVKKRRHAFQCIGVCGLPACGIETNLKVCARQAYIHTFSSPDTKLHDDRCKTVAYVGSVSPCKILSVLTFQKSVPRLIKLNIGNMPMLHTRSTASKPDIDSSRNRISLSRITYRWQRFQSNAGGTKGCDADSRVKKVHES